jgi:DNA-binding MarR family transcriptional regulator
VREAGLVDGLVQLSFLVQNLLGEAGAAAGMTTVQMRLLGILRDREPAMSEIARVMNLDKSSVTGLVDRAERRGLVTRVCCSDDGRSTRVALTPVGQQLAKDVTRDVGRRVAQLVDGLSIRESEQLAAVTRRLLVLPISPAAPADQ